MRRPTTRSAFISGRNLNWPHSDFVSSGDQALMLQIKRRRSEVIIWSLIGSGIHQRLRASEGANVEYFDFLIC